MNPRNYRQILKSRSILTHFQPIISLKARQVIGAEALSRGIVGDSLVPPLELLNWAKKHNKASQFDALCRDQAIKNFCTSQNSTNDYTLFLNVETSLLSRKATGPEVLKKTVEKYGLSPNRIAIELVESGIQDSSELIYFVENCRQAGFLIVLDDVGAENSNLDRILIVKPDIIKIDKTIIQGIANDHYRQSILNSLVSLARMIGCLVLAEGVETWEDMLTCYNIGVQLFQGFYFCHPAADLTQNILTTENKLGSTAKRLRTSISEGIKKRGKENQKFDNMFVDLLEQLEQCAPEEFENHFSSLIEQNGSIECIYALNQEGIQTTQTVFHSENQHQRSHPVFQPALKGADHSLKDYYYYLSVTNSSRFHSLPYLSMATGHLCRTLSRKFLDKTGNTAILCIDFIDKHRDLEFPFEEGC